MWTYFLVVILVNGLFVMQLLVGILVEKFQQLKRQYENVGVEYMMSETQRQMVKALRKIAGRRGKMSAPTGEEVKWACRGRMGGNQ